MEEFGVTKGKKYYLIPKVGYESIVGKKEWKRNNTKYLRVLGLVKEKQIVKARGKERNPWVPLSSGEIRRITNTRQYPNILAELKKYFLECDGLYIPKEKSHYFRFKVHISTSNWEKFYHESLSWDNDNSIITRERDKYQEEQINKLTFDFEGYYNKSIGFSKPNSSFNSTEISISEGAVNLTTPNVVTFSERSSSIKGLNVEYPLDVEDEVLLYRFVNNPVLAFRDSTSRRLHSPITNLPKVCRPYLTLPNKERIISIDLVNAQPLLLNLLYIRKENNINKEFYRLTNEGEFYEFLLSELNQKIKRSEIKVMFFKYLYGDNRRTKMFEFMRSYFPDLSQFIWDYKEKHGYKALSVSLQKCESELFIDRIMTRVKDQVGLKGFVCSLHDSIWVDEKYSKDIKIIIQDEIQKVGLKGVLSCSYVN